MIYDTAPFVDTFFLFLKVFYICQRASARNRRACFSFHIHLLIYMAFTSTVGSRTLRKLFTIKVVPPVKL